MDLADLLHRARTWAENDPDAESRAELESLIGAPDPSKTDLADRFAGALEFGTAGLRGIIGAGPNRMSRAVVLRTTHGLAQYLLETIPDAKQRGVVIGFDGRRMSREFAEDTACVLAGAGIHAQLFADVVPTPLLAFAVSHLACAAGVMVTASHNPPEYNGYKAYWGNGAQIIPPTDVGIAKAIDGAPAAKDVVRPALAEATKQGLVKILGGELGTLYLAEVKKLGVRSDGDRSLSIVYTPMHGVGDELARRAFADFGFPNVVSVPEQQKPDGAFPTVLFPNPEEKGAMDLSFALARARKADLVVANDPDADRLAIALPSAESATGYVQLTGNQVGALLGHYLLTGGLAHSDRAVRPDGAEPLVIASIVSSPMLGVMAGELGAHYEEVLTGFKWIANRALALKAEKGWRFVFGFKETLGYTVGELVHDKDGVSAAVLFAELTAVLRAQNTTVLAHLEGLYRRYGLFV
ncbi:MAG TPA: phospho-sugar mutase, partial [Labilithrix sp.]|nr:phospho-sugar mutase [Labilithrix sp.]